MLSALFDSAAKITEKPGDDRRQLLDQLDNVKRQLALVEELFNLSDDDDLTEACIYQQKAFGAYFRYLYKQLKAQGMPLPADLAPLLEVAQSMG